MKKFLVLALVSIMSLMALCSCGSGSDGDSEAAAENSAKAITVDKDSNSVTIDCTVASSDDNKHWFIVNKDGSMAKNTVLVTDVSTDDFYNALAEIAGEKVWNDTDTTFESNQSINDLLAEGIGHDDFAKFDVTVSWDGNTYALDEVITNASFEGKAYDGNYDIAFAGNLDNQHKEKTGCITCFGGCYMGITTGYDTPMMIEYTPKNLPDDAETIVKVTYTLK